MNTSARDDEPAKLLWLQPSFLKPPHSITRRQERIFLLVGLAALFAGYNESVFDFAIPQIQASFHIAENRVGPTFMLFRLAVIGAMALTVMADLIGRRRLLLFTIVGQALATLGSAFAPNYDVFITLQILIRIFSGTELALCYVVIIEEMNANMRGWSVGMLAALNNTGGGLLAVAFAFVNVIPYGWRALYALGAIPLFVVAFLRRRLPETRRFEIRASEVKKFTSHLAISLDLVRRIATEYPGRVITMIVVGTSWAFAMAPAGSLGIKYLQQTLGYAPWQTTLITVPGGMVALWFNILAGRLSDRIGRRRVIAGSAVMAAVFYAIFFSGLKGPLIGPLWTVCFFFGLTTDTLLAALGAEIFPTAYRATVGALSSLFTAGASSVSLYLEGALYDRLGGHGPAILVPLVVVACTVAALFFLPEPAGRVLEEIADSSGASPQIVSPFERP